MVYFFHVQPYLKLCQLNCCFLRSNIIWIHQPETMLSASKKNGMQYLNSEVPHIISGKGRTSACAQRVTIQWSWMWPFRGTTVPCLHSEHGYLCLIYLSEGFLILIYFNFMMKCIFSQFKPTTYIFNYKKNNIYIYYSVLLGSRERSRNPKSPSSNIFQQLLTLWFTPSLKGDVSLTSWSRTHIYIYY